MKILKTLQEIIALPAAFGTYACECGRPEMRNLPDRVFRCPARGAEILPLRDMQGRLGTAMDGKGPWWRAARPGRTDERE